MGRGFPIIPRLVSLVPHCSHLLVQDWVVAWPSPYLLEGEESRGGWPQSLNSPD